MTEQEWLECQDPQPMLHFVRHRASPRQLRLFACACLRLIWDALPGDWARNAVELGERYADELLDDEEREVRHLELHRTLRQESGSRARLGQMAAHLLSPRLFPSDVAARAVTGPASHLIPRQQTTLLRDIVGNPFHRVKYEFSWSIRSGNLASRLAEGIYQEKAFDRLPILADALEDAGCDNTEILSHCRVAGPHVLGCWVVDLISNKQ
jgi:hypothetical protein